MTHAAIKGLLWLAFLLTLFGNARYLDFVIGWHVWLMVPSVVVLFIAVLASVRGDPHCQHPDHDHGSSGHDWTQIVIHALPLAAVWALGDGRLGTHAALRSGFWQPTALPSEMASDIEATDMEATETTSSDLRVEFTPRFTMTPGYGFEEDIPMMGMLPVASNTIYSLYRSTSVASGTTVSLVVRYVEGAEAQVITPERLPPGIELAQVHGLAFRFVMVCCAADARPVGAAVIGLPPPPGGSNDTWWRIRARWIPSPSVGFAALDVEQWEVIPAPANEYLSAY
jgi:hypothetical protein